MRNLKNKSLIVFLLTFVILSCFSFTFATDTDVENDLTSNLELQTVQGIYDDETTENVYKFSEHKQSYMTFFKSSSERIIVDSDVSNSGLLLSNSSIEVENPMKKLQLMFTNDTIRIKADMEYPILFSQANVIVDKNVTGDLIVFAKDTVTINEDANISGDIIVFAKSLKIYGNVEGSVLGNVEDVTVAGNVSKDLRVNTQSLNIDEAEIGNQIFIRTYNKDLKISEKFPNSQISVLETKDTNSFNFVNVLVSGIIASILYTFVYMLIKKLDKKQIVETSISKIKPNFFKIISSGCLTIILIPLVFLVLMILSFFKLYYITIPVFIIYVAYLLVVGLLSTLIIGIFVHEYMTEKYYKDQSKAVKNIACAITLLVLFFLARLPKIGSTVTLLFLIIAYGMVYVALFTKKPNINDNELNNEIDVVKKEENEEKEETESKNEDIQK